jgi:hypothetical protein
MTDISQRIANLSPEKRALLELRLLQSGVAAADWPSIPRRGAMERIPLPGMSAEDVRAALQQRKQGIAP